MWEQAHIRLRGGASQRGGWGVKCKTRTHKPEGCDGARFGKRPLQWFARGLAGEVKTGTLKPQGCGTRPSIVGLKVTSRCGTGHGGVTAV